MEVVILIFIYLVFNGLLSLGIFINFIRVDIGKLLGAELGVLCISLGIAPALISVLLYACLILLPQQSSATYLLLILSIILSVFFTYPQKNYNIAKALFFKIKKRFKNSLKYKFDGIRFVYGLILILGSCFIGFHSYTSIIWGHDTLEYLTLGKQFFIDKQITFSTFRYYPNTGFYYVGLHGFSYPLIYTFEALVSDVFQTNTHLYFKSISLYYGLLIILLGTIILTKFSKWAKFLLLVTLFTSIGFFFFIYFFHLDSLRLFFILASFFLFFHIIKENKNINSYQLLILGMILGLSSFIHSINFIGALIFLFAFFLFSVGTWTEKFKHSIIMGGLILLFGGGHYLIDIIWGTGWIFGDIKFI